MIMILPLLFPLHCSSHKQLRTGLVCRNKVIVISENGQHEVLRFYSCGIWGPSWQPGSPWRRAGPIPVSRHQYLPTHLAYYWRSCIVVNTGPFCDWWLVSSRYFDYFFIVYIAQVLLSASEHVLPAAFALQWYGLKTTILICEPLIFNLRLTNEALQ